MSTHPPLFWIISPAPFICSVSGTFQCFWGGPRWFFRFFTTSLLRPETPSLLPPQLFSHEGVGLREGITFGFLKDLFPPKPESLISLICCHAATVFLKTTLPRRFCYFILINFFVIFSDREPSKNPSKNLLDVLALSLS